LDIVFVVKLDPFPGVEKEELCSSVKTAITGAEYNVVAAVAAIKLPGSFEELEELANNIVFRRIRIDPYHRDVS
jgi:hypothetical protein